MLSSIVLAISAFLLTAFLHLNVLRWSSGGMASIPMQPTTRILAITTLLFAAHLAQIAIYAVAFAIAELLLGLGAFSGEPIAVPLDYLYYSAITYTSLGIGDIFPTGHLRFLTGVEALNGLLLIAWSGSFLFVMMNRFWDWQPCATPHKFRSRKD